ncbi:MAG: ATP-binding protein [Candidatus Micrarchaeota archaeon]
MDDIYARNILKKLKKWANRKEIFAIKGPRQAGKTTLMLMLREYLIQKRVSEKNIVFLNCDDFEVIESFTKDPKKFIGSYTPNNNERYYIFMDEYQYVPNGGKILKILYDFFPNIKFIISGSSSLELTDKTAKYLVGRVFYFTLFPFSFGEFINAKNRMLGKIYNEKNKAVVDYILKGKNLDLEKDIFLKDILKLFEEYMLFGGYPEVIKTHDLETKKTILKNIYDTYINKDIIELLKITDVMTFRKTVGFLAAQHAGLLNFESLASDSKSYYREIKRFLSVLEETYVIKLLPPFYKNLSTELKKNPKAYFLDSGLRNYVIKNFNVLEFREDRGRLAEGLVLSGLINTLQDETGVKYWRTLSKAEVDFIITSGNDTVPIEVKFSEMKKPSISRSFRSFITAYKPNRGVVLTKNLWAETKIGETEIKFMPICYL